MLLTMRHVVAGYDRRSDVLRDVSIDVNPGEAWVVLGPNGAGKSSMIRVAMGLLRVREGSATVCDRLVGKMNHQAFARNVAWVPQHTEDNLRYSVLELVLMGRSPHLPPWGLPGRHDVERSLAALDEVGILTLKDRSICSLSGGERRRAWLARALVQDPKLLVLDEPTAFLDIRHQVEVLRAVRRRVTSGLGTIAVLHDLNVASHFATHVVLLANGEILAQGPVDQILTEAHLSKLYGIEMRSVVSHERVYVPKWEQP